MSKPDQIIRDVEVYDAVILNGESLSQPLYAGAYAAGSVQIPSVFTGTALQFLVSNEDPPVNFLPTRAIDGSELAAATVAANMVVPIPAEVFHSLYFKTVTLAQSPGTTLSVLVKG